MAQKGGFVRHKSRSLYAIKVGSCTTFSVKVPLSQGILRHTTPHFMVYLGVICFANMGGGGGQNYFHFCPATSICLFWPTGMLLSGPLYFAICDPISAMPPIARVPIGKRGSFGKRGLFRKFHSLETLSAGSKPTRICTPPAASRSSAPRGGANLCRFVPVRSLQTRASGREFVHVCFGLLGPLVQVGANSDGFGAF